MKYYFAPLEGVTGYAFRLAHARHYAPADKYFTPFFSPTREHVMPPRVLRELCPEHNSGLPVVPQLLCRSAEDFIWAARCLQDMGYGEVNLNLGCPSGTVTAKGKGSGFLAFPEELDRFFEQIFSVPLPKISVKTRLGLREPEEFGRILEIYNRYPIHELSIHPRVSTDMYRNFPRMDAFSRAFCRSRAPVCYNGDLRTAEQLRALAAEYEGLGAVMLGRGLCSNLALLGELRGGPAADMRAFRGLHEELYEQYSRDFGSARNAMLRMKELWSYTHNMLRDSEKQLKRLNKTRSPAEYEAAVESLLAECELLPPASAEKTRNFYSPVL